jgi:uncharacterized protein (TIGR03435 family)
MMRRLVFSCCCFAISAIPCFAQSEQGLHFDAASIKPASSNAPQTFTGGPGTQDPGRIVYTRISLKYLIATAYGTEFGERISGPSWLDSEYAVTATIPGGSTRKQFHEMLQNLIVDRFGLVYHSTTREVSAYALAIASSGAKMPALPSERVLESTATGVAQRRSDRQGYPILAPGEKWQSSGDEHGISRFTFSKSTMGVLADMLRVDYFGSRIPVVDKTALSGEFSFHLELPSPSVASRVLDRPAGGAEQYTAPDPEAGFGEISHALEKQLGLRLIATKIELKSMVIDRIAKSPTSN